MDIFEEIERAELERLHKENPHDISTPEYDIYTDKYIEPQEVRCILAYMLDTIDVYIETPECLDWINQELKRLYFVEYLKLYEPHELDASPRASRWNVRERLAGWLEKWRSRRTKAGSYKGEI